MNYCPVCGSNDVCYTILCDCDKDSSKEEHIWTCLACRHKTIKVTSSNIDVNNIHYSLKVNKYLKELLKADITKLTIDVLTEKEIKLIKDLQEASLIT